MMTVRNMIAASALVAGLTAIAVSSAVLSASKATAADMTTESSIVCTLQRLGDCKADGKCIWKPASARQKSRKLKVDFSTRKAAFVEPGKSRPAGTVVKDETKDGVRHFSLARRPTDPATKHMTATLDKAGRLQLSRRSRDPAAPRMVADTVCVKG